MLQGREGGYDVCTIKLTIFAAVIMGVFDLGRNAVFIAVIPDAPHGLSTALPILYRHQRRFVNGLRLSIQWT